MAGGSNRALDELHLKWVKLREQKLSTEVIARRYQTTSAHVRTATNRIRADYCDSTDGDPSNNRLTNLVWGTRAENSRDKKHHAGQRGKLLAWQVVEIKQTLAERRVTHRLLALKYGVSKSAIGEIARGRNHAEL